MINTTASLQSHSPPSRRVVEVTSNQVILLNSPGFCPTLSTLEQRLGPLPSLPHSQDTPTIVQTTTVSPSLSPSLPTHTTPPPLTLLPITQDTETSQPHKVQLDFYSLVGVVTVCLCFCNSAMLCYVTLILFCG